MVLISLRRDWQRFHDAILARVPNSPFAGPDTAYNNEWLVPFARSDGGTKCSTSPNTITRKARRPTPR